MNVATDISTLVHNMPCWMVFFNAALYRKVFESHTEGLRRNFGCILDVIIISLYNHLGPAEKENNNSAQYVECC